MEIIIPREEEILSCARVYLSAYRAAPWNEEYEEVLVAKYIAEYLNSDSRRCYALVEAGKVLGVALVLIVPSLTGPYLRIEDFCIDERVHRKSYGSTFIKLLQEEAEKMNCDCILLGTQRDFPSHHFYLKNGFQEIESVLLYKEI